MPAASKIARDLQDGNHNDPARADDGSARVRVQFHHGVPLAVARTILESHGAIVLDELTYPNHSMLEASLDRTMVPLLARSDQVRGISMPMAKHIGHNEEAAEVVGADVLW